MEKTRQLAAVLSILLTVLLVLNILVLPFIPGLVVMGRASSRPLSEQLSSLFFTQPEDSFFYMSPAFFFGLALVGVWGEDPATVVLTVFLLACALRSAVILRQGLRVLRTVRAGQPFQHANARSLRITANCCFLVCCMALVRCIWSCMYFHSLSPLFTYNALFIPVFLMAGLLCLVMASLFGQAAVLREENDLTI